MNLPPHIIALREDAERDPRNPEHLRLLGDAYEDEGQEFRAAIERMAADHLEAENVRNAAADRLAWRQIAYYTALFAALFGTCIAMGISAHRRDAAAVKATHEKRPHVRP